MKLNKWQLDFLSSACGLVVGSTIILATNNIISFQLGGIIEGLGIIILGCLTQRPADAPPTTEQVEQRETRLK